MTTTGNHTFPPGTTIDDLTIIEPLGRPGDEGQVYLTRYKNILNRATKFVHFDSDFAASLDNEVRLLALVRHRNIVRILDYGTDVAQLPKSSTGGAQARLFDPTKPWFHFSMNHIDGVFLDQAWANADEVRLISLLQQLVGAVQYLHERGILHMDIKPTNVLVEAESGNVTLIDLGFAVVADSELFKEAFPSAAHDEILATQEIYVFTTKEYTDPDLWEPMVPRFVSREEIQQKWFPHHDLFALGKLIEGAASLTRLDNRLTGGLRIIADSLADNRYASAEELARDLAKLEPGYVAPIGVPDMSLVAGGGRYFVGAVESVAVSTRLQAIVEHRLFQRLRLMSQLERISEVYMDARHSRFSHSLLTFHYCKLALASLLGDLRFRLAVEPEDVEGALLMALLHDVGHYPLSHMFEDFKGESTNDGSVIADDEDLFPLFVLGETSNEAHGAFLALGSLREQLATFGGSFEVMKSIAGCVLTGADTTRGIHRLLAGLIDSAIDMDKVAYLREDSYMAGVPYGSGIDLHGLLSALRMPGSLDGESRVGGPVVGIDKKGLSAAESVILARYWMLSRVYWHHTNRAIMAAYKYGIRLLMARGEFSFDDYIKRSFWWTEAEATRWLAAEVDKVLGKGKGAKRVGVNPLEGLCDGRRSIYKRLVTVGKATEPMLHECLLESPGGEGLVAEEALRAVNTVLGVNLPEGTVVVDIPKRARDVLHLEQVLVLDDADAGDVLVERPLATAEDKASGRRKRKKESASLLLSAYRKEFLIEVKKCRIFLKRDAYAQLEAGGLVGKAQAEVRRGVSSKVGA